MIRYLISSLFITEAAKGESICVMLHILRRCWVRVRRLNPPPPSPFFTPLPIPLFLHSSSFSPLPLLPVLTHAICQNRFKCQPRYRPGVNHQLKLTSVFANACRLSPPPPPPAPPSPPYPPSHPHPLHVQSSLAPPPRSSSASASSFG